MKHSDKQGKGSKKKSQLNAFGQFRSSTAAQKKMGDNAQPVELGQGGVRFVREGKKTFALPCGDVSENTTVNAVRISYDILTLELSKVAIIVKQKGGRITGAELAGQFPLSPLQGVADPDDWAIWAEGFSPQNPERGRPKSAAITFLDRKMPLDRATLKSYFSRANSVPKR